MIRAAPEVTSMPFIIQRVLAIHELKPEWMPAVVKIFIKINERAAEAEEQLADIVEKHL